MSDVSLSILLCRALASGDTELWEIAATSFGVDVVSGFCRRFNLLPFIPIECRNIAKRYNRIKTEITALRMATEEVNRLQLNNASQWFLESDLPTDRVCLLKGHALLNTVLKSTPWRTCSDVDCLLREQDLLALCQNEKNHTHYSSLLPCRFHSEIVWSPSNLLQSTPLGRRDLPGKTVSIDFHWTPRYLLQDGYVTCNQEKIFNRAVKVTSESFEFCVPAPVDLYASLLLHAVDGWNPQLKDVIDLGHLLPTGDLKLPLLDLVDETSLVENDNYLKCYLELLHLVYQTDDPPEKFPKSILSLLEEILNKQQRKDTTTLRKEAYLPVRSFQGLTLRDRVKVYLGYFLPDMEFYRLWTTIRYPYFYHPLVSMKNIYLRILGLRK